MQSSKNPQSTPGSAKRRSGQLDFSNLGPLKTGGTVGFSAFRDKESEQTRKNKARKKSNGAIAEDSEDDEDDDDGGFGKMEADDDKDDDKKLRPEDAESSGELADGVNRIRVSDCGKTVTRTGRLTPRSLREHTLQIRTGTLLPRHLNVPLGESHQRDKTLLLVPVKLPSLSLRLLKGAGICLPRPWLAAL